MVVTGFFAQWLGVGNALFMPQRIWVWFNHFLLVSKQVGVDMSRIWV